MDDWYKWASQNLSVQFWLNVHHYRLSTYRIMRRHKVSRKY